MTDYVLHKFLLPLNVEGQFVAELWSLGALGFESHPADGDNVRLDAYFGSLSSLADAFDLTPWHHRGVREMGREQLLERDWLADYRDTSKPFDVGRNFRVDPRDEQASELEQQRSQAPRSEVDAPSSSDRRDLKIPARTAFGTGSHESTRLAVEWLEAVDLKGLAVLDVGTGSGILSFVAETLGARRVVGFDIDAQAVCMAKVNARLNQVEPLLFAGRLSGLVRRREFDLALVNVLPENILGEMPYLADLLEPRGRVISSGNLVSRRDELLALWAKYGFTPVGEKVDAEWAAWLLQLG